MDFVAATVWTTGLVFARVAAIAMLMPGLGEQVVPATVRLAIAFLLALALAPAVQPSLPAIPAQTFAGVGTLIQEIMIGLMIGASLRFLFTALATASSIIGIQTGLAFSQTMDPTQGGAGTVISSFLGLLGLVMLVLTDLHHVMLRGMVESYTLFSPGSFPQLGDVTQMAIMWVSKSFAIGAQMAAPLIVFGLVFNLGLGVVSKLMPQAQIFFIAMPANIMVGLFIFILSLSSAMLVWLEAIEGQARLFSGGG
jgi:flagellar biosynthesis protein FliR